MAASIIQHKSFEFALEIIHLYQELIKCNEYVISKQLLRSGTSIGANVEEASAAQSRKDFLAKCQSLPKKREKLDTGYACYNSQKW